MTWSEWIDSAYCTERMVDGSGFYWKVMIEDGGTPLDHVAYCSGRVQLNGITISPYDKIINGAQYTLR